MTVVSYLSIFLLLVGALSSDVDGNLRLSKENRHLPEDKPKIHQVSPDAPGHHTHLQMFPHTAGLGKHTPTHHVENNNTRRRMQYEDTPCPANQILVQVKLQTDYYANETMWELRRTKDNFVVMGGHGLSNLQTYADTACLPQNRYNFTIYDRSKDGICCKYGTGSFKVSVGTRPSDLKEKLSGGNFGASKSVVFGTEKTINNPPKVACANLSLSLTTDAWPEETWFTAVDLDSHSFFWTESDYPEYSYYFDTPNKKYDFQQCINPSGCYEVSIMDSVGDGMDGKGFTLTYDGKVLGSGGNFTTSAVYQFGKGCAYRPKCKTLKLELTTDVDPSETSVRLDDYETYVSYWWDTKFQKKNKKYELQKCIDPLRCWDLSIYDTYGDGLVAPGGFTVRYGGQVVGNHVDTNFTSYAGYYIGNCPWAT